MACSIALLVLWLAEPADVTLRKIKDDANAFPERFVDLLNRIGIDPTPNSGSYGKVRDLVNVFGTCVTTSTVILCVALIPSVQNAAKIVTYYQIMEVCMRAMAALFTIIAVTTIIICYSGLVYKTMQSSLVPLTAASDFWISLSAGAMIALAMAMIPVGLLGVLAEYFNDQERTRLYAKLAYYLAYPVGLFATVAFACGFGAADGFVNANCRSLLVFGSEAWYGERRIRGLNCSKYYGEYTSEGSSLSVSVTTSSLLRCNQVEDVAFAWEYSDPTSCTGQLCRRHWIRTCSARATIVTAPHAQAHARVCDLTLRSQTAA